MSSIMEKSTSSVIAKRSFFLRTGSIQKIKCSATYPFRLAGTKINRDAIKQLIEVLIHRGRILSQNALLNLYIATFKLVGAICSLWVNPYDDKFCDKSQKTDNCLSFQQRLLEKIQRIQNHKSRLEPKTQQQNNSPNTNRSAPVSTPTKFDAEIARLREYSTTNPENSGSCEKLASSANNDFFLGLIVYGSAVFIYLQLLMLTYALNTTNVPPGLLFLISSLLLIAFIAFKVFFVANVKRAEARAKGKELPNSPKSEETATSTARQSRPRLKRVIDLDSKTLSKVKLL